LQNGPSWEAVLSYLDAGQVVAGVDEVGRGAWAGPVVAGAVILPPHSLIDGLNDSKLLTSKRRLELNRVIRRRALAVGLGWVSAAEVDAEGLTWAVQQSGLRALAALDTAFDLVMLDGKHNYLAGRHASQTLVKADQLVVPVAAGSVVAKVARDRYMEGLAKRYPGYAFDKHKGYGTKAHAAALAKRGPTDIHRRTWGPFKEPKHVD
jgi:ribonuclease HII